MAGNLLRSFYSISGARFARIGLHLLITPIVVRLLGTSYGDYAFVISVWAMVMVVSDGGVFVGVRKFLSERRNPGWEADVFRFYARLTIGLVAVMAAGAVVSILTGIVGRLGEQFVTYTVLLVLLIGVSAFMNLVRSALMGFHRESVSESLFAGQMLVMGVVGVGLAAIGLDVVGLLVGHIVGTATALVAMTAFLIREIPVERLFRRSAARLPTRRFLSFSSLTVVLLLLTTSLYHVDILFVRVLIGQEATAQYKAALLAAEFLWIVPIAVQQTLLHSSAELWATERYDTIQRLSATVTRYSLVLTALLTVGIAVLAEEFVGLYFGPGFGPAVGPLLILLPGAFGFAIARGIFSIGHGKGEMRVLILATAAAAGLNLVLNVLLIPTFGMVGAAVATSVGYGSMFVFHVGAARRIGFDPLTDMRLLPIVVTSSTTGLVLVMLDRVIASDVVGLVVVPIVGVILFSVLALKTGALDTAEVRYITDGVLDMVGR